MLSVLCPGSKIKKSVRFNFFSFLPYMALVFSVPPSIAADRRKINRNILLIIIIPFTLCRSYHHPGIYRRLHKRKVFWLPFHFALQRLAEMAVYLFFLQAPAWQVRF